MTQEEKNHQAYNDVLDGVEPSMPFDKGYMAAYHHWVQLSPYTERQVDADNYWLDQRYDAYAADQV